MYWNSTTGWLSNGVQREEILHTEEEVDGCWLPTGLFIIAKESLLLWGTPPEVNEKLANIEKEIAG